MYHLYRCSLCLLALGTLLIAQSQAAPPHGYGGSSSGFGFSIGGSPGSGGIGIGFGNVPDRYDYDYRNRNYYDRDYNRNYYPNRNYGNIYGGSGLYFGSGSKDFRWGVGIPFGYDDYDWYAPYYNSYSRRSYNFGQGYYQNQDYYGVDNSSAQNPPTMEHPPIPTAGQVARLTDDQLKMMISVALDAYSKELDGFTTGAGWKKHFQLAELKDRILALQSTALDSASRSFVAELSQKFDAAAKDPSYEVITIPWSFQTLLLALNEYSLPPAQRQAHELSAKTKTLHKSLDSLSTGEGWIVYLQIKELEKMLEEPSVNNADSIKKLEKTLARFDEVAQNPQYKSVADLRGFDVTRILLQQFIRTLQTDPTKKTLLPPPPTESNPGEASL